MSFKRTSRLFASAAVTAGLAFGGLALTAPTASAATGTTTASYSCTNPSGIPSSTFTVPATFSLQTLPQALTANVPVPAGTPIIGTLDFSGSPAGLLPSLLLTLQTTLNSVIGKIPGSDPLTGGLNTVFTQLSGGVATLSTQLGSFTPSGSSLPIPLPAGFDFATIIPVLAPLGIKCTLVPGSSSTGNGTITTIPVVNAVKQGAKIKVSGKKVVRPGQKSVVKVKVKTTAGLKGVGSVVAKVKGAKAKTKVLKNGKVRFVFKGLKVGSHKIKVKYLGNGTTNPAKKKFTVRVRR